MRIFVSHCHADGELARAVQRLLREVEPAPDRVFLTSEVGPAPSSRWRDEILRELALADIVVGVCTDRSRRSAWVAFELGFALGRAESDADAEAPPVRLGFWTLDRADVLAPVDVYQSIRMTDRKAIVEQLKGWGLLPPPKALDGLVEEAVRASSERRTDHAVEQHNGLETLGLLQPFTASERAALLAALAAGDTVDESHLADVLDPDRRGAALAVARIAKLAWLARDAAPEFPSTNPPPPEHARAWLAYLSGPPHVSRGALELTVRVPASRARRNPADGPDMAREAARLRRRSIEKILDEHAVSLRRVGVHLALWPTRVEARYDLREPPASVVAEFERCARALEVELMDAALVHYAEAPSDVLQRLPLPLPFALTTSRLVFTRIRETWDTLRIRTDAATPRVLRVAGHTAVDAADCLLDVAEGGCLHWEALDVNERPRAQGWVVRAEAGRPGLRLEDTEALLETVLAEADDGLREPAVRRLVAEVEGAWRAALALLKEQPDTGPAARPRRMPNEQLAYVSDAAKALRGRLTAG